MFTLTSKENWTGQMKVGQGWKQRDLKASYSRILSEILEEFGVEWYRSSW